MDELFNLFGCTELDWPVAFNSSQRLLRPPVSFCTHGPSSRSGRMLGGIVLALLLLGASASHLAEITFEMEEHSTECFYEWVEERQERITLEFQV